MEYIAVYYETAYSGIGIIDIEYGVKDYCIVEYFGGNTKRRTKNEIFMDLSGRSYIRKYNKKYYLDEFMRT